MSPLDLRTRGRWPPPDGPRVAIVGSRRPSPYGEAVAEQLGLELARAGVIVVSGLALGIDAAAHRGALNAGGVTVAVMGTGVDIIYPAAHGVHPAQSQPYGYCGERAEFGVARPASPAEPARRVPGRVMRRGAEQAGDPASERHARHQGHAGGQDVSVELHLGRSPPLAGSA